MMNVVNPDHPAHRSNWEPMYTDSIVNTIKDKIAQGTTEGGRISIIEDVEKLLLDAGIAWYQQIPPEMVGIEV